MHRNRLCRHLMSKYEDIYNICTMGLSVLLCFVVYQISTVSRPALHCTGTVCHQTVAAKSLSLRSRDRSCQCRSLLITVDQTMCGQLPGTRCVPAPAPAPSEQNMTASEAPHSPRHPPSDRRPGRRRAESSSRFPCKTLALPAAG